MASTLRRICIIAAGSRETLGGYRHLIPVQCPHLSACAQSSRKKKVGGGGISFFLCVIFAEFEGVVVALVSGGRCWTLGFGQWLRMYCQCSWEDIEKHVTTKTVLSNWEDEIGNNLSEHCPGIDNVLFFSRRNVL